MTYLLDVYIKYQLNIEACPVNTPHARVYPKAVNVDSFILVFYSNFEVKEKTKVEHTVFLAKGIGEWFN